MLSKHFSCSISLNFHHNHARYFLMLHFYWCDNKMKNMMSFAQVLSIRIQLRSMWLYISILCVPVCVPEGSHTWAKRLHVSVKEFVTYVLPREPVYCYGQFSSNASCFFIYLKCSIISYFLTLRIPFVVPLVPLAQSSLFSVMQLRCLLGSIINWMDLVHHQQLHLSLISCSRR